MTPDRQAGSSPPSTPLGRNLLRKIVIFALLLAVAGLATMAKNGQYFPQSSPAHYVSISTKMNVAHSTAHFAAADLQPLTSLFSLQPPLRAMRVEQFTAPPLIFKIYLADSRHLRAPPAARS
jgi:hypothetical protein